MRKGLYIVTGTEHPDIYMQNIVYELIENNSLIHFKQEDLYQIKESKLENYNVIVLFFHVPMSDKEVIENLKRYVENGGTLLGIHGVAASFKGNDTWFELIGGRFIKHPPVTDLHIKTTVEGKRLLDIEECYEVSDEQYCFEIKKNINILVKSYLNDESHPSVWENRYGRGKVFYCALGHHKQAIHSKGFQEIIIQLIKLC